MSVTEIEYVEEKETLQIISRLFVDDFEKLLKTRYDENVELIRGENNAQTNTYISKYFEDKLKILIQNKQMSLKFIGKRYEDDLIICYFEAIKVKEFNQVTIKNLILTDLFEDQKNLIHFKKDGNTESLMLMKDKSKGTIKF
ncbi:hypothetical protein KW502_03790 [Mesonia sp. JHPTF-M18]|uniref:Peptidase E n=2 Tax=Mesonia aestuariivivens TaxID=2796128 RepID=A0ABS6VZJ0_9FLAO|nr:DUF6702 family protein [Mesonia aestuariivivens]MBW2960919.1 hypothetical protein [Mesonia aestuariivivens]